MGTQNQNSVVEVTCSLTSEDRKIFKRLRRLTRGAIILHADDRRDDLQRADQRDHQIMREIQEAGWHCPPFAA